MPVESKLIDDIADLPFTPEQREKLIRYLSARKDDGAAPEMATLKGSISAADSLRIDPKRRATLDLVKATLKRWNYPWQDDAVIDSQKLDVCFAGRDVTERLALKVSMRACGLLPRVV
jgi:hypothetical protein